MKQLHPSIVSSERTKTVKKPEQLGSIMATGHFDNILQLFFPSITFLNDLHDCLKLQNR